MLPLFVISAVLVLTVSKLSVATSSPRITVERPGKLDTEHNCLDPHATKAEHLPRPAAEARGAAETLSFGYRRNFMVINGISQNFAVLQGPFLGGRL
jgi:hypothetical protein